MKALLVALLVCFGAFWAKAESPAFLKVRGAASSPLPVTGGYKAATFGLSRFVAVGDNKVAFSLDDGVTWQAANGFTQMKFSAVIFAEGLFVAVGSGRQIATSRDGSNWSVRGLPASMELKSLAYGDGTFAVAGTNVFGTSSDGISWALAATTEFFPKVAFANDRFLFLPRRKQTPAWLDTEGFPYWFDPSCTNSSPFPPICPYFGEVSDMASTPETFVALVYYEYAGNFFFRSNDGRNWSRTPVGGGIFYAENMANRVVGTWPGAGLADALTGEAISDVPAPRSRSGGFAASDSTIIALGDASIYRRPNPLLATDQWIESASESNLEIPLASCAVAGKLFVAVDNAIPQIIVSTNGLPSLTNIVAPEGCGPLTAVRYADGKFVAVGKGGSIISSTNATNWIHPNSNAANDLLDLTHGNGLWVAVGESGSIVTSSDASVFTPASSGTNLTLFGVTFGGGQFVCVGETGLALTSANGIDWSLNPTPDDQDLYSVVYGDGKFVAVGTNGTVCVSANGADWQTIIIPNVSAFRRVVFGHGCFVALTSENNFLYSSTDGLNWTSSQITDGNVLGLDFSDNQFWLTGEKSGIWKTRINADAGQPTLTSQLNASNQFVLTLEPQIYGTFQIEAASSIPPTTWEPLATLTNVQFSATWTDTNPPQPARLYRVRKL